MLEGMIIDYYYTEANNLIFIILSYMMNTTFNTLLSQYNGDYQTFSNFYRVVCRCRVLKTFFNIALAYGMNQKLGKLNLGNAFQWMHTVIDINHNSTRQKLDLRSFLRVTTTLRISTTNKREKGNTKNNTA